MSGFRVRAIAATCALSIVGGAAAQDRNPDWIRKPDAARLKAVLPVRAVRDGVSGKVMIRCVVTTAGTLGSCKVASETPAGYGFGEAALLLAPSFLLRPAMRGGKLVEGDVSIPINFEAGSPMRSGPAAEALELGMRRMAYRMIWDDVPTRAEMAAVWPAKAADDLFGHVVVRCRVKEDGALKACQRISEDPKGRDFYEAAKKLAPLFRLRTTGMDAKLIKSIDVNLPIHLANPGAAVSDRILAKPDWTRSLAPNQAEKVFPPKAADAGLKTGRAVVDCRVEKTGDLKDCKAIEETPAAMDFGTVAVELASSLAVNAWTLDGEPSAGGHVRFAIRVNRSDDAEPPAPGPK
jgi:TonB family protein